MLRLSLTPLGLLLFATIIPLASSHPQINTQIPSTTNNFTTTAFSQTKSTTTYSPSTISITLHTSSDSNSPLTTTTRPTANSTTTTTPRTTPDEATRPINTDSEPYPDSKRSSNYCACGSLVDDGFTGKCQYGDGYGYVLHPSLSPPTSIFTLLFSFSPTLFPVLGKSHTNLPLLP